MLARPRSGACPCVNDLIAVIADPHRINRVGCLRSLAGPSAAATSEATESLAAVSSRASNAVTASRCRRAITATLTVRGIDDQLRDRLRVRAAHHSRSMEAEVREILEGALATGGAEKRLGSRVHHRFEDVGGFDLDPIERTSAD